MKVYIVLVVEHCDGYSLLYGGVQRSMINKVKAFISKTQAKKYMYEQYLIALRRHEYTKDKILSYDEIPEDSYFSEKNYKSERYPDSMSRRNIKKEIHNIFDDGDDMLTLEIMIEQDEI